MVSEMIIQLFGIDESDRKLKGKKDVYFLK